MEIRRIFLYPVKSLLPVEVSYAELTSEGLRFDRQYILVKMPPQPAAPNASESELGLVEHLAIKKNFLLALFQPSIHDGWSKLTIRHTIARPESSITMSLTPSPSLCANASKFKVSIFGTSAIAIDMGDNPACFFRKHLGMDVRLCFIGGNGKRMLPGVAFGSRVGAAKVLPPGSPLLDERVQAQRTRFADAAPYLITSSASEEDVRSRLPVENQAEDVIIRLRPNIHIGVDDSTPPYDEDDWDTILVYDGDPKTKQVVPKATIQLYGLLAKDRRVNPLYPHKPVFGQYAYSTSVGQTLRVGDVVRVLRRNAPT
ncbi:unnamed protein product [Clonostachys solani]|uniref:MOSC domain-containing protein n=1 Tax=Clonostachys solani TaxID=160281 RepID=A0A9N9ZFK1_9HYPO|nr:unnamed protein product [Clonostachys solani]